MSNVTPQPRNTPKLKDELGFGLIHLTPLLMIWTGATTFDWVLCAFLYFFRMFWITAGYHRYFAHKTYQTSRLFQFLIAFFQSIGSVPRLIALNIRPKLIQAKPRELIVKIIKSIRSKFESI